MRAELLFSGDELLTGKVLNRNATYLSSELNRIGVKVLRQTSVGDDLKILVKTMQEVGARKPEILVISGGLGSTPDDLTVEAVSKATGRHAVFEAEVFAKITEKLGPEDQQTRDQHRKQAYLPAGAKSFDPVGTAPGFYLQTQNTHVFALPGVPKEMVAMFERDVKPILVSLGCNEPLRVLKIKTVSLREAEIVNELSDLNWNGPVKINTIANPGEVSLILTPDRPGSGLDWEIDRLTEIICKRLGPRIYSLNDDTLAEVVTDLLKKSGKTLGLAESCTGGLIAKSLTDIPGSSVYFKGGVVLYSNEAKVELLGVDAEKLEKFGAVSAEVADEMAVGARNKFLSDIGISVTGIAGPAVPGSNKPVGLVFTAISTSDHTDCAEHHFRGDREAVRQQAAMVGMDMARLYLQGLGTRD